MKKILQKVYKEIDSLADNWQWEKVADVCLTLLEEYPDDLEALYNVACAYYQLGQFEKVEKYCSIALSHPDITTVPVYRDLLKKFYDEIRQRKYVSKAKKGLDSSLVSSLRVTQSKLHKYIPEVEKNFKQEDLFLPNFTRKESWIQRRHLSDIELVLSRRECTFDFREAKLFGNQCWEEILSAKRHYQVSSKGRVEIFVSTELFQLTGLNKVRFIQEGAKSPAVFLRFEFSEFSAIGIVKIKRDGNIVGFHKASKSPLFETIIETTALSYYRDLVIPDPNVRYYWPGSSVRAGYPPYYKPPRLRELPRIQHVPYVPSSSRPKIYEFKEWYYVQERARHHVDGHTRWIGHGFIASEIKQRQAREAGVNLQMGYTWVVEHERGDSGFTGPKLRKYDLVERTQFFPPERASAKLRVLFH